MKQRSANEVKDRSIAVAAVDAPDGTQPIPTIFNAVRETGDAAEQMLGAAVELSCMAEQLRSEADRCLVVIRIL